MKEINLHCTFGSFPTDIGEQRFLWQYSANIEPSGDGYHGVDPKQAQFFESQGKPKKQSADRSREKLIGWLKKANQEIREDGIRDMEGPYVGDDSEPLRDLILQKFHDGEATRGEIADLKDMVLEALEDDLSSDELMKLFREFPTTGDDILDLWEEAGLISIRDIRNIGRGGNNPEEGNERGRVENDRASSGDIDIIDLKGWGPVVEAMASDAGMFLPHLYRLNRILREKNPNMDFIKDLDAKIRAHAMSKGILESDLNLVAPRSFPEMREFSHYAIQNLERVAKKGLERGAEGLSKEELERKLGDLHERIRDITKDIRLNGTKEWRAGINMQKQQLLREYYALDRQFKALNEGRSFMEEIGVPFGRTSEDLEREGRRMDREDREKREEEARREEAIRFLRDRDRYGDAWVERHSRDRRTERLMDWEEGEMDRLRKSGPSDTFRIAHGAAADEMYHGGISSYSDQTLEQKEAAWLRGEGGYDPDAKDLTPKQREALRKERDARNAKRWLGREEEGDADGEQRERRKDPYRGFSAFRPYLTPKQMGEYLDKQDELRKGYIEELAKYVGENFEKVKDDPHYDSLSRAFENAMKQWSKNPDRIYGDLAIMRSQIQYMQKRSEVADVWEEMEKNFAQKYSYPVPSSGGYDSGERVTIEIPGNLLPSNNREKVVVHYEPYTVIGAHQSYELEALFEAGILVEKKEARFRTYEDGRPRVNELNIRFSKPGRYVVNGEVIHVGENGPEEKKEELKGPVTGQYDVSFGEYPPRIVQIVDDNNESHTFYLQHSKRGTQVIDENGRFGITRLSGGGGNRFQIQFTGTGPYHVTGFASQSGHAVFSYKIIPGQPLPTPKDSPRPSPAPRPQPNPEPDENLGKLAGKYEEMKSKGENSEEFKNYIEELRKTRTQAFRPDSWVYTLRSTNPPVIEKGILRDQHGTLVVRGPEGESWQDTFDPQNAWLVEEMEEGKGTWEIQEVCSRSDLALFQRGKYEFMNKHATLSIEQYRAWFLEDPGFGDDLRQQNVGNCYLLAGLKSLQLCDHGEGLIRSSIRVGGSNYYVKIPIGNKDASEYMVTEKDLQQVQDFLSVRPVEGGKGWQILEAAHTLEKFGRDKNRKLKREESHGGFAGAELERLVYGTQRKQIVGDLHKGLKTNKENAEAFLNNYSNGKDIATVASLTKESDSVTYLVAGILFFGNHAYSIANVDTVNKVVTVLNPHNTAKEIRMSYDTFLNAFRTIDSVHPDQRKMFAFT